MSYETYLLAQMQAIKTGKPLEVANWSLLLDSNLKNSQHLAAGSWGDGSVYLAGDVGDFQYGGLRLRPAVDVL